MIWLFGMIGLCKLVMVLMAHLYLRGYDASERTPPMRMGGLVVPCSMMRPGRGARLVDLPRSGRGGTQAGLPL